MAKKYSAVPAMNIKTDIAYSVNKINQSVPERKVGKESSD